MKRLFTYHRPHKKGQSMVEFALALPILLLLMVGIIEFARILQAWMAVQNAARFGLRFLVTGEYDPKYCEEAAAALGLTAADTFHGDPANDCHVPDEYGNDARDLTDKLVDWARLPSAKDVAQVGATGVALDNSVSGNYIEFLSDHAASDLGIAADPRYFHVTVCSSRDANEDGFGDFQWNGEESAAYQTLGVVTCYDSLEHYLMDDAGGPGDRVRVYVTFKHSTIVPFISEWWPIVPLTAWREGIVERFRTSRISGIGSEIIDVPTDTPTYTSSPTFTNTPTSTSTSTSTNTPTATNTPTDTSTPTPTSTPDCSPYSLGDFSISGNNLYINVNNSSGASVMASNLILNWDYAEDLGELMGGTSRSLYLDWIKFSGSTRWGGSSGANDYGSPTDTTADSPSSWYPPTLGAHSTTVMQSYFYNTWTGFGTDGKLIGTDFGITVYLDNGCTLERPAVERPLPENFNCDLYTISGPTLSDWGAVIFSLRNNDQYATNVSSIQSTWDYLEDFFEIVVSDPSVRADWISYDTYAGGYKVWGSANGGGDDYESPTDTQTDVTWSTVLPRPFDTARDYYLEVEFDRNSETVDWFNYYGIKPSDFGVLVNFENGCQLELPAVARPVVTPTPNCDLIYSGGASFSGTRFQINVINGNFAPAYLTNSTLVWPDGDWSSSMYFDWFRFNGNRYWNPVENINTSPVSTVVSPPVGLNGQSSAYWQASFGNWPAVPAGGGLFSGDLLFDYNGLVCPVYDQIMIYPTPTATATSTATTTFTATNTGTATNTRPPTNTSTATNTATNTSTATVTPRFTDTNTPTNTSTITNTPTNTVSPTITYTPTNTSTRTPTPTGPSPTPTSTPTICLTPPELGGCH